MIERIYYFIYIYIYIYGGTPFVFDNWVHQKANGVGFLVDPSINMAYTNKRRIAKYKYIYIYIWPVWFIP